MGLPAIIKEIYKDNDARLMEHVDSLVRWYEERCGKYYLREVHSPIVRRRDPPQLVLLHNYVWGLFDICKDVLLNAGYPVSSARNGRLMLAKMRVLRPKLIVTGLNVVHFYPPAYHWMLMNLDREDGIPMIFITGASPARWPREIPMRSPKVAVFRALRKNEFLETVARLLSPRLDAGR